MKVYKRPTFTNGAAFVLLVLLRATCANAATISVDLRTLYPIGTIDERYQSYNIEMAEVVGGKFWKPYDLSATARRAAAQKPASPASPNAPTPSAAFQIGEDPAMFQARQTIDLSNPRLRTLAAALGPAYMRVSGTWANSVYFQDSEEPAPKRPPQGFQSVLTRQEWAGAVNFSKAVNARIVTSFAISAGVRDARGVWTPDQARAFLAYTQSIGGPIAAAEFFNEPSLAAMGGAPPGYNASSYARHFAVFRPFAKSTAPEMLVVGPGSVGEGGVVLSPPSMSLLKTEDLLAAHPRAHVRHLSYHFYGAASIAPPLDRNPRQRATWHSRKSGSRALIACTTSMQLAFAEKHISEMDRMIASEHRRAETEREMWKREFEERDE